MKKDAFSTKGYPKVFWIVLLMQLSVFALGQTSSRSLLINHGSNCGSDAPEQDFIVGSTFSNPQLVHTGNVGVPYYSVLAAYNPEDHKMYYAKMDGAQTDIYAVDYNLNGALNNPIPSAPTYTYNYPLNQLCFDNYGDNYVFSKFNASAGRATLNRIDITTGDEIAGTNKQVVFPNGNYPNTLNDGDVVVLPNGRMFASFGNAPSKLYEIDNTDGPGKGTATFLTDLPRVCFSIAYVDGNLVIAGSDGGGCYYFVWDINSLTLSAAKPYPLGKSSADMSSMTVGVGVANRLLAATMVTATSANLVYEVVLKNKGNTALNNLQLTNNLARTFGTTSISNVQLTLVSNPANLLLNPAYDGVTDTNLVAPGQALNNFPLQKDSLILRIQFTANNLSSGLVYKNSVLSSGSVGDGATLLVVTDSSNNGNWSRIDIDRNGVSDDPGENAPTPFAFGSVLAVSQLELKGSKSGTSVALSWPSANDVGAYLVERSFDGRQFQSIALIYTANQSSYALHDNLTNVHESVCYYRIKALKTNQSTMYSNILVLKNTLVQGTDIAVFPNPVQTAATVQVAVSVKGKAIISLVDEGGRTVWQQPYTLDAGTNFIPLSALNKLRPGYYWVKVQTAGELKAVKMLKQ